MTEYDQKILNLCIKMGTRRNSRSFNNAEEHLLSERPRNVRPQNDNYKIAWARANWNPKCMIIGIFGGINSLEL